ncbi:hypothetical protein M6D81_23030 [Paenibacillus sp. J5C_2022]|uniref:hypothetical protein n=1 Tax=Paenibacillus sp. J5C2022 TaxID=2977129 RepID=UPI0021D037E0|nr:hypothetical protein [Paenibacillus sp. J5C2022]MCU6711575.1 hypothetical protein [Paenibacillus sp. J5C2022]
MKKRGGGAGGSRLARLGWPILGALILAMACIGLLTGVGGEDRQPGLLSIGGAVIPEEEFMMFFQDEKAATADYFYKTYGAEFGKTFWLSEFGGEVPLEHAKANALKKLVQLKAEQQLAVTYGVLESSEFGDIVRAMEKEQSLYGADSLNRFQKYMVYHSKLVLDTMVKFNAEAGSVKEEELVRYYEANRMERFKAPDEVGALVFRLAEPDAGGLEELFAAIIGEMRAGTEIGELQRRYIGGNILGIELKQYGSEEGKDENSSGLEELLKEHAYALGADQTSGAIAYGNESYRLVCLERRDGAVAEYDEVRALIEDELKEQGFRSALEDAGSSAEVVIHDQSLYDSLQMP